MPGTGLVSEDFSIKNILSSVPSWSVSPHVSWSSKPAWVTEQERPYLTPHTDSAIHTHSAMQLIKYATWSSKALRYVPGTKARLDWIIHFSHSREEKIIGTESDQWLPLGNRCRWWEVWGKQILFGDENSPYLIVFMVVTYCLSRLRIVHPPPKKKKDIQPYMLAYACSVSTWEGRQEHRQSSRLIWAMEQVPGQPQIQHKTLSQKSLPQKSGYVFA